MKYLYGDSTPFPLVENFLVTLCAATEACVSILRADEAVEESARQVKDAEAKMAQELARLSALGRRVEEFFTGGLASGSGGGTPTDQVASKVAEFAQSAIKQARVEVVSWRESVVLSAARAAPHAMVLPALDTFLSKHQLPDTSWSLTWQAGLTGGPAAVEAYSRTPARLDATFSVEVPQTHLWARPVRVAQFEREMTISLTRKRFLRDAGPCPERLERLFITSVVHTPDRAAMTLSRSPREPSPGIEIVVRGAADGDEVTATCIERDGVPLGPPERLSDEDAAAVRRLWTQIEVSISELVCFRSRLTAAKLGDASVGEVAQPESVAVAIIQAIAPIVSEIAARSGNNAELALKQQIADGRREEIFIPYDAVLGPVSRLAERHQTLFDSFGMRPQSKVIIKKLPPPVPRVPPQLKVASA